SCLQRKLNSGDQNMSQQVLSFSEQTDGITSITNFSYDHAKVRELASHMVLVHEYPFSMMDHHVFNKFMKAATPFYKKITRQQVKEDCYTTYELEKRKLKHLLKGARISWVFENQYLVLREWQKDISENHGIFQELDIWVQAWNIPLHWFSMKVGRKVGGAFKHIKDVQIPHGGPLSGKCLRLKVTLDLNSPIPRCTHLKQGDRKVLVAFKYEKLLSLCYYCGMLGHLDKNCDQRATDIRQGSMMEGQFGEWLKAQEFNSANYNYYMISNPITHPTSNNSSQDTSTHTNNQTDNHPPSPTSNISKQNPIPMATNNLLTTPISPQPHKAQHICSIPASQKKEIHPQTSKNADITDSAKPVYPITDTNSQPITPLADTMDTDTSLINSTSNNTPANHLIDSPTHLSQ
ncbi:Unknown protein, partial [Striga hermonthica]